MPDEDRRKVAPHSKDEYRLNLFSLFIHPRNFKLMKRLLRIIRLLFFIDILFLLLDNVQTFNIATNHLLLNVLILLMIAYLMIILYYTILIAAHRSHLTTYMREFSHKKPQRIILFNTIQIISLLFGIVIVMAAKAIIFPAPLF